MNSPYQVGAFRHSNWEEFLLSKGEKTQLEIEARGQNSAKGEATNVSLSTNYVPDTDFT